MKSRSAVALPLSRRTEMLRLVAEQGSVSVPELADLFRVSTDTVRRDLDSLASSGAVLRTHGGAVRAEPGILEVRPYAREESARLLEPWLGSGLSLDDLPVPRMIVARAAPGTRLDLEGLRGRVTQVAPSASVDDHRAWINRMRSMTNATVFAGIGVLVLVIIATIISVSFATRGAMAANRPIVEVLHFVGASDRYIANRFLRHFLRLGFEGGAIGCVAAMLMFGFSESIATWFSGTPVGDQFAALLGTFSLRPSGYLVLAAQTVLIAAITALAARRTLFATLDEID